MVVQASNGTKTTHALWLTVYVMTGIAVIVSLMALVTHLG